MNKSNIESTEGGVVEKSTERKIISPLDTPFNETMFHGWPVGLPLPTIEEYRAAELRYKESIKKKDISDYRCGLSFVMSTYVNFVWLPFFFPYESGRCQQQLSGDKPI